jgi:hypothetical protein
MSAYEDTATIPASNAARRRGRLRRARTVRARANEAYTRTHSASYTVCVVVCDPRADAAAQARRASHAPR